MIAAGGTPGILISPSVVLAVYACITEQDIGRLFIAGIVPGLLALAMYMATVRLAYGRALPAGEPIAWTERLASVTASGPSGCCSSRAPAASRRYDPGLRPAAGRFVP